MIATTCPFCAVGCGMGLNVEADRVTGVEPLRNHPVSRGDTSVDTRNRPVVDT